MAPVRIKYYGLLSMTRFAYLVALAVAAGIAVLVMLVAAIMGALPPLDTIWSHQHHVGAPGLVAWLHNYLYWLILACLVAQGIDTFCTMRAFATKEMEHRARLDKLLQEQPVETTNPESIASHEIREDVQRYRR